MDSGLMLVLPLLLVLSAGCGQLFRKAPPIERTGPRIGIRTFDVQGSLDENLGVLAQDTLVSAFFRNSSLRIVERDMLEQLFEEQRRSGMDPKLLPLEALVRGKITGMKPSIEERNYVLWQSRYRRLEVAVDLRCINVHTGEVIYAVKDSAVITRTNRLTILFFWTVKDRDEEIGQPEIRDAIEDLVQGSVKNIARAVDRIPYTQQAPEY